jgi:hypothetical protein
VDRFGRLRAKLQREVAALDQEPQNFDAACGVSTGLLAELQALVSNGSLAALTFPAPVPGCADNGARSRHRNHRALLRGGARVVRRRSNAQ